MSEQTIFHLIFVASFTAFTFIRMVYHRKAAQGMGKAEFKEGRLNFTLRKGFGIPFILALFAYMFYPPLLSWAAIDLPAWAQWIGVVLSLSVVPLILWIQHALGLNFSTTLHVREEHTLVTSGPYERVRHPMYTVLFLQAVGFLLLTRNLLIGGVYLAALIIVVVSRINNEEKAMLEKFGDEYHEYMQRTGRFLPRLFNPEH